MTYNYNKPAYVFMLQSKPTLLRNFEIYSSSQGDNINNI